MANVVIGLGVSMGLQALGRALTPNRHIYNQQESGRIDDLSVRKTGQGWPLGRCYGRYEVKGCPIFWAVPKIDRPIDTSETTTSGGGKSATRTTTTTTEHRYYGTFAFAIGDGPIAELKQIKFNDEIWYNADGQLSGTLNQNSYLLSNNLEIYLGTSTQAMSPTIQSYEGNENNKLFRNTVYCVVKDLPLANFGNELPGTINAVVFGTEDNLNTVLLDVGKRVGLIPNVELIAGTTGNISIIGAKLKQDGGSAKSFIDEIIQRFFVLSFLDDTGAINYIRQEVPEPSEPLALTDLGARSFESTAIAPYDETIIDIQDLPSTVSVSYYNVNDGFSGGNESWTRASAIHYNSTNVDTSLAMTPGLATEFCFKFLQNVYQQSHRFRFYVLPEKSLTLTPRDKVSLPLADGSFIEVQVASINIGADLIGEVDTYSYSGDVFSGTATRPNTTTPTYTGTPIVLTGIIGTPIVTNAAGTITYVAGVDYTYDAGTGTITIIPGGGITNGTDLSITYDQDITDDLQPINPNEELPFYGQPTITVHDINRVRDSDPPSVYLSVSTTESSFGDTAIYARPSGAGEYTLVGAVLFATTRGTISTTLPLVTGLDITSVITVVLATGQLNNLTTTQFANNEQIILIGTEQIVVKNAVLTAPLTYQISELKRGHNGTIPASHAIAANVTVVRGNRATTRLSINAGQISQAFDLKAVPDGSDIATITAVTTYTLQGIYWKPYAGSSAVATKDTAGNIYVNWTHNNTGLADLVPQSFEVDILNGIIVVRTIVLSSSNFVYDVADQITDFGSAQSTITANIYQLSTEYGRGYVYEFTATPALSDQLPTITAFSPTLAEIGDTITVIGTGLASTTVLAINSVNVVNLIIVSDTEITGEIAATTTTGKVSVTTLGGTATSLTDLVITTFGQAEKLTANRTYYVRTDGNDANTGLANTAIGAFLTPVKAASVASGVDKNGFNIFIQLAAGTYTGAIDLFDHTGVGEIIIQGDPLNSSAVVLDNIVADTTTIRIVNETRYWIRDLTINNAGIGYGFCLMGTNLGGCFIDNVRFGSAPVGHILSDTNGFIGVADIDAVNTPTGYTIFGNSTCHVLLTAGGVYRTNQATVTLSGVRAFSTAYLCAETGGIADIPGVTYVGTATGKKYQFGSNVSARIDNNDLTLLPGDLVGTGEEFGFPVTNAGEIDIELIRFLI